MLGLCQSLCYMLCISFVAGHDEGRSGNGITCQDPNLRPVDWFIVYKTPQDLQNEHKSISEGVAFYYMDSHNPLLTLSQVTIDQEGHALYNTLQQIYLNYFVVEYAMYNDESPKKSNKSWTGKPKYGLTKGVYAFDKRTGFWLISTIPKFPPPKGKGYAFHKDAKRDGHIVLCVTLNSDSVQDLHEVFKVTRPQFYDQKGYDARMSTKQPANDTLVLDMYTHDNMQLKCLAKGPLYQKDLYDSLVAPSLQKNLWVQSLRTGAGLPSTCSQYKVINIVHVKFPDTIAFPSGKRDHAKWAVSETEGIWMCIGDHDRRATSFDRGGGALCMTSYPVWKAFHNITNSLNKC
ncbi:plancitoxin-1-like [Ostrea edulis]|uniref:plancitoxin-1-like n=1 Tax=Ostrea edulis TaxID=37623 RepID=UPI0020964AE1|nr:plancitoxin-1-like [Ostrea edulis]